MFVAAPICQSIDFTTQHRSDVSRVNVVESIISMCFDVTDKTKDNIKARKGLADICSHPSLEIKRNQSGNESRPQAPYCVKPEERKDIFRWLKTLKFPDRYAANIKHCVNVQTGKLNGLKSHDYHIIMERLLLAMFHGYFNNELWRMFAELSCFYRRLCAE